MSCPRNLTKEVKKFSTYLMDKYDLEIHGIKGVGRNKMLTRKRKKKNGKEKWKRKKTTRRQMGGGNILIPIVVILAGLFINNVIGYKDRLQSNKLVECAIAKNPVEMERIDTAMKEIVDSPSFLTETPMSHVDINILPESTMLIANRDILFNENINTFSEMSMAVNTCYFFIRNWV